jgi:ABC-type transport system involved in cytochrome c biogenesis ATPase subunit
MKTSKSFRLSSQALQALAYLSSETGTNETAIVEIALSYYRKAYNAAKLEEVKEVISHIDNRLIERVSVVSLSPKKKRKRSR